tara:strand:+ start:2484 stop:3506 length:1023 start_codon:yes stop_codon:yes gene_type:complete
MHQLHLSEPQQNSLLALRPVAHGDLATLAALDEAALSARLRIVTEDGTVRELRPNYAAELSKMLQKRPYDQSWISVGEAASYFNTRSGSRLPLVFAPHDAAGTAGHSSRIGVPSEEAVVEGESIHVVVDQSSSMQSMNAAAYAGARELVEAMPDEAAVTFSTFASEVHIGEQGTKRGVLDILDRPAVARGQTALRDAMVRVIDLELTRRRTVTTVVVVTDGQDTISATSEQAVRDAVERFQGLAGCRILFMGSNQDAVVSAQRIGIGAHRALTFGGQDANHMRVAFRAASQNAACYRSFGSDGFTSLQRSASVRPSTPPVEAGALDGPTPPVLRRMRSVA